MRYPAHPDTPRNSMRKGSISGMPPLEPGTCRFREKKRGAGGAPAKIESACHSLFTLFALLFGFFLFQAGLILSNKRAEFRIVVFLAV
jgi:hypothetical protein